MELKFEKSFEGGEIGYSLGRIAIGPIDGPKYYLRYVLMPDGNLVLACPDDAKDFIRFFSQIPYSTGLVDPQTLE